MDRRQSRMDEMRKRADKLRAEVEESMDLRAGREAVERELVERARRGECICGGADAGNGVRLGIICPKCDGTWTAPPMPGAWASVGAKVAVTIAGRSDHWIEQIAREEEEMEKQFHAVMVEVQKGDAYQVLVRWLKDNDRVMIVRGDGGLEQMSRRNFDVWTEPDYE